MFDAERNRPVAARESAGTSPDRYRSVSRPCASGENTMVPMPRSPTTSSSDSVSPGATFSTCRLNIE